MLIKCPECGKEISDKASACPFCGCPQSAWTEEEQNESSFPLCVAIMGNYRVRIACQKCGNEFLTDPASIDRDGSVYIFRQTLCCPQCQASVKAGSWYSDDTGEIGTLESGKTEGTPPNLTNESTEPKEAKGGGDRWLFAAIALVVVLCVFFGIMSGGSTGKTSSSAKSTGSSYSASSSGSSKAYTAPGMDDISSSLFVLAEQQVQKHLKAPGTAKMCQWRDTTFKAGSDDTYMMAGWVDAENSYGATVRTTWGIMAQLNGEKLTMLTLTIDGETVYP